MFLAYFLPPASHMQGEPCGERAPGRPSGEAMMRIAAAVLRAASGRMRCGSAGRLAHV